MHFSIEEASHQGLQPPSDLIVPRCYIS
uniref:Uncharacterized protein n=1 Tax=Rhizophora mucronata TaxID=61149 RepID=A0A2P2QJ92_RHIMU